MRGAWAIVACMACGRVGFEPLGERAGVDAPGTTSGDLSVTRVSPTGVNNPYPVWNGNAFAVVTSYAGATAYQTFDTAGEPLGAAKQLPPIEYVVQTFAIGSDVGLVWISLGGTSFARVDPTGTVTTNVVIAPYNAHVAKNLDRDELCVAWADPDTTGPERSVRAARTTTTGTRLGSDLIVTTSTNRYRRVEVACRGTELYVMFSIEIDGWYDYFLHTFDGSATQLPDTPIAGAAGTLMLFDAILMGPNLNAPVIAHGRPAIHVRVDSFDLVTPRPVAGPELACAAQFAIAGWDGREVQVAAACYDATMQRDTMYMFAVSPLGELLRAPVAVQTAAVYGGGPTQIAVSPTGHVALGFTEWDVLLEAGQGYVGFLAPP